MAAPANSVWIGYFGAGQVSWDGSTVTFPGTVAATKFLAGDGTAGAPSYSFANDTDIGVFLAASNRLGIAGGGGQLIDINAGATSVTLLGSITLGWGASVTAPDVSLSRGAANRLTLAVGDVFNLAPTAFTSLPAGAEGNIACVTDSNTATWGATIAGGGANNVLAFHNGTNWVVMGA